MYETPERLELSTIVHEVFFHQCTHDEGMASTARKYQGIQTLFEANTQKGPYCYTANQLEGQTVQTERTEQTAAHARS